MTLLAQPMTAGEFLAELARQRPAKPSASPAPDPATKACAETILTAAAPTPAGVASRGPRAHRQIKLGVDVHLDRYVVGRQIDGGAPQPPQRFSPAEFLKWAPKQTALAEQVSSCYESGPFGCRLHRQLTALGITNYVGRPRDWDEDGKKVKTDQRAAKALGLNLDRYLTGNREAFCVVRGPSEAQEQARSRSLQREQLQQEKQRLAAQGRREALYYGAHLEGEWWAPARWKELALPPIVMELLAPLRRLIQAIEQELKAQTQALQAAAPQDLPVGLGQLTYEILEREICDWDRFKNRRQVASYTGRCPREDASAQRRFQGSINQHGNGRVRTVLVEAAWRLIPFQPTYTPVAKWLPVWGNSKTTKRKRKQIAVAIGRQFSVAWWRVRTQRCTAQDLGLKLTPIAAPKPGAAKVRKGEMNEFFALALGLRSDSKNKKPGAPRSPPGADAPALQGRLGAQVALPQSPILRAVPATGTCAPGLSATK